MTKTTIIRHLALLPALLAALLLPTACHRQQSPAPNARQLYTADTLMRIDRQALQSPQSADDALRKLHQLRLNGQGPLFKLEWVEGSILMHQKKYLQAAEAYRNALNTDSVQRTPQYYLNLCKTIMLLHHQNQRLDSAMHYANLLLLRVDRDAMPERAKQDAYWCMSQVYHTHGDTLNRNETARLATRLAWQTLDARIRSNAYIARALNNLFNIYSHNLDYALQDRNLNAADTLARRMQQFTAGLDTLVLTPQRPDGIPQWTLSQNHNLLCHQMARLCHATARTAQEQQWVQRLKNAADNTDPEAAIDAQTHLAEYYLETRHYAQALPLLAAIRQRHQQAPDSISPANAAVCRQLSEACQALRHPAEALLWQRRSQTLQDSIDARTSHSDALQLAAISHTREQRLQISRQQSTISRLHTRIALLAILALAICITALIIYLYLRQVKRRNIQMARLIKQQHALYSPRTHNQLPQWLKETEEKLNRQDAPQKHLDDLQKHFDDLQTLMQEEKPYLSPDLKPADLSARLALSATELNAATQEAVQLSPTEYINRLRLEHALFLLETSDYIKIATVAQESGFGTVRHFYRLFQKEYNMSPADYRNAVKGMDEKEESK
nr:helix-turn-helix transcriptional regulator [Bacteroides intestinalis]